MNPGKNRPGRGRNRLKKHISLLLWILNMFIRKPNNRRAGYRAASFYHGFCVFVRK